MFSIAENEEIFSSPPYGLLTGIYLFYENWSIETFGKRSREEDEMVESVESNHHRTCNISHIDI